MPEKKPTAPADAKSALDMTAGEFALAVREIDRADRQRIRDADTGRFIKSLETRFPKKTS